MRRCWSEERAATFDNNIVVQAGSSGTVTLGNANSTTAYTYTGSILLNKSALFVGGNGAASSTGGLTFSGVISGVGGITAFNGSPSGTSAESIALTNIGNSFSGAVVVTPGTATTLTTILSYSSIANGGVVCALGADAHRFP